MVKAIIKMFDGTEISVEGSPEEVAKTKELLHTQKQRPQGYNQKRRQKKSGPIGLILELKSEGFFDNPKTMADVCSNLQEGGHYYPLSSLSPALIRLVKQRELGRIKGEGGKWQWVKR